MTQCLSIPPLLLRILSPGSGSTFHTLSNAEGKIWILPRQEMRIAMGLYQPSSFKGRLVHRFFPLVCGIRPICYLLKATSEKYALDKDLREFFEKLFGTDQINYSVFCGTPSVHQKITMQLNSGKRILGYCKFTDNSEVAALFEREYRFLSSLHRLKIDNVPEGLFCGNINGVTLFVQSTMKTPHSKTVHAWGKMHDDFIEELCRKTRCDRSYEQTDFARAMELLETRVESIPEVYRHVILAALLEVRNTFSGRTVHFSAYHGDFTPWNSLVVRSRLFVFDFEYAQMEYPSYLDRFHFFTQTAIFARHLDATRIVSEYRKIRNELTHYFSNPDFSYKCYLLAIISQYVSREKEGLSRDSIYLLSVWTALLKRLTT